MPSNRFAWERAVKASKLPAMTRLVLLTLATEMDNETRQASVTNAAIAEAAGMSERSVYKYLKVAIEAGWVTRLQRGHHVEGRRAVPSTYVGLFPEPTGSTLPVGDGANPQPVSGSVPSQPERGGSQPERARKPTGKRVPTSHSAHSEHCSSGPKFDDIDIEVHRQIKRKKERGEIIRNERALRASIRQEILAQRELDRLLAEREAEPSPYELDAEAARALGRNLAGVALTEGDLFEAFLASNRINCTPALFHNETLPAWRERTTELQERSA